MLAESEGDRLGRLLRTGELAAAKSTPGRTPADLPALSAHSDDDDSRRRSTKHQATTPSPVTLTQACEAPMHPCPAVCSRFLLKESHASLAEPAGQSIANDRRGVRHAATHPADAGDGIRMHSYRLGSAADPLYNRPRTSLSSAFDHSTDQASSECSERLRGRGFTTWAKDVDDQRSQLSQSAHQGFGMLQTSALPQLRSQRTTSAAKRGSSFITFAEQQEPRKLPVSASSEVVARKRALALKEREEDGRRLAATKQQRDQRALVASLESRPVHYRNLATVRFDGAQPQGPLDHDWIDPSKPLTQPHVVRARGWASFAQPQCDYRDEEGAPIHWPWNAAAGGTQGREYMGGGQWLDHSGWYRRRAPHTWDATINKALDAATADGRRGRYKTGVKAWFAFTKDKGLSPDRPLDPGCPLFVKLEEEWLFMEYVCALVEEGIMTSGEPVSVESARVYASSVQGWHAREHGIKLAGGLKLERLPQMLKGLRRIKGDKPKKTRSVFSPKQLRTAMDATLSRSDPLSANIRAAIATAFQGLLRSVEYTGDNGKLTLLREDVVSFDEDSHLVMMMHPGKNMQHLAGKTCPLVIGAGGTYIDAVDEIANLRRVDRASGDSPLFRDPKTGKPLSYDCIMQYTKAFAVYLGLDPTEYATHCYRISGATASFAAGATDLVIRTMGRWSSDLHRLYVRCCFEKCRDFTRLAGSAEVTSRVETYDEVDYY